jgi:hypothetical protein
MLLDEPTTMVQTVTFFTCIWEVSLGGPIVGLDRPAIPSEAFHGFSQSLPEQSGTMRLINCRLLLSAT